MLKKIIKELRLNPGTKAADIAEKLHTTRKDVNQVLYGNKKIFVVKEDFTWTLLTKKIVFGGECWLKTRELEATLKKSGCPTAAIENQIHFVFPKGCKILLESAARLMALSNQLIRSGKSVILDFSDSSSTRTYLTRMGFYVHLDDRVEVLPKRPSVAAATRYKGNNSNLVEFASIDPAVRDEHLPDQLRNSFVSQTSERYFHAAFTIFAEFINNIGDHSKTTEAGFAALQAYANASPPHIQTVISDSGVGIVANLRPILSRHIPDFRSPGLSPSTKKTYICTTGAFFIRLPSMKRVENSIQP
jgi:hypothetical protein